MNKVFTIRTLGGSRMTGQVKNPRARLREVASRISARQGLAGTFELVDRHGATLDPEITLDDLPDGEEVTLASELTPASRLAVRPGQPMV